MGLKFDGIATSQHLDSSGEVLNVEGHDISDLEEGRGVFNFEHSNKAEDILGHVIYARKILKQSDCENDRQKAYWKSCEKPFVYVIGELYDGEEHPGACAAAAMMRYYHKRKEKMLVGMSIEGATLKRDDNILERSVGRRIALTLRPCNKTCIAGIVDDPIIADVVNKSMGSGSDSGLVEIDSIILEDGDYLFSDLDPAAALKKSLEVLEKTLTAGNYNVAPGQLSGGAALCVEDKGLHNRAKAAFRDWDRRRPLKEALKAALPEVSDDYIEHFTDLAEQMSLTKGISSKLTRIGPEHSLHPFNDDDQKRLVEGLYADKGDKMKGWEHKFNIKVLPNDSGKQVVLKHIRNESLGESPKNATVYHDMAKNFFGMGAHVPTTTYIQHPHLFDGKPTQAMEFSPEMISPLGSYKANEAAIEQGRADGTAHKLALMDMVMGHSDRHLGNMLIDKNGRLLHIDNDSAFTAHDEPNISAYGSIMGDNLHIDAGQWLAKLDPKKLGQELMKRGMSRNAVANSVKNLMMLQNMGSRGATFEQMRGALHKTKEPAQDISEVA